MSNMIYTPFLNYLRIAVDAQDHVVQYVGTTGRTALDSDQYQKTAEGQATVVVVYTVIALECYIHNYAARKLGENRTKKHIDKMGHYTKWLLVPQLATGQGIPADHQSLVLLQQLISARNLVVHAKAVNITPDRWSEQKERIFRENRLILEAALVSMRCVGELGSVLCSIDTNEPSAHMLAKFLEFPKLSLRFDSKTRSNEAQERDGDAQDHAH